MMAKLLLVWTLFLTICWYTVVSGEIEDEEGLKKVIANKVIPTFRKWAQDGGGEQFAVLMLMNTNHDWNRFEFLPPPTTTFTSIVQPKKSNINNYVAAIPGKNNDGFMHSEQRIYEKYLKDMYAKYYKREKEAPKAIVLYSWIVPCTKQSCATKGKGCTDHTIKALKKYITKETQVIVAYTTKGSGKRTEQFTCNFETTEEKLKNANIDVVRITGKFEKEDEQEAMMENLIRLLQILE